MLGMWQRREWKLGGLGGINTKLDAKVRKRSSGRPAKRWRDEICDEFPSLWQKESQDRKNGRQLWRQMPKNGRTMDGLSSRRSAKPVKIK